MIDKYELSDEIVKLAKEFDELTKFMKMGCSGEDMSVWLSNFNNTRDVLCAYHKLCEFLVLLRLYRTYFDDKFKVQEDYFRNYTDGIENLFAQNLSAVSKTAMRIKQGKAE